MHDAVPSAAIQGHQLTVVRGNFSALQEVSFAISPGSITGLLGPSGSGKTTLMRAIMGVQAITSGTVQVLDQPAGSEVLRKSIGYVTQAPAIYDDLTTRQNVQYFATILGVDDAETDQVIGVVDLTPQKDQLAGSLSGGQRARVSLAVALLGNPEVLILDEPTVGLDPVLRQSLWQLFRKLAAEGHTLLVSSHIMDEAEQCEHVLLLREGQVLYGGTKAGLLTTTHTRNVEKAFLKLAGARHE